MVMTLVLTNRISNMRNLSQQHSVVNYSDQSGFTFIEMVITLIVSSILAIGIITYIRDAVDGIDSTARRNQLSSTGRIAIDRMAMELHNALPNSIRTTTAAPGGDQCIEFIPVSAATSYVNPSFRGSGSTTFDVVDIYEEGAVVYPSAPPTKYAVIYPRRQNQLYDGDNGASTGWPNFPNRRPIQTISSMAASTATNRTTVTLTKSHRFRRRSPSQRFFVVEDPISYCIVSDKLYRYTNYGFFTAQTSTEEETGVCEKSLNQTCLPNYTMAPDKMLITDNIDNTGLIAFNVGSQSLTRNSLVAFEINFEDETDSITLNHEVLTRSVP